MKKDVIENGVMKIYASITKDEVINDSIDEKRMWDLVNKSFVMRDVQNCNIGAIIDEQNGVTYIFKNRVHGQQIITSISNFLNLVDEWNEVQSTELKRTKYDRVMISTAEHFSTLSTCNRLNVGAVISKDGRPLVTGYNGTISGTTNDCEETCPVCNGQSYDNDLQEGCDRCGQSGKVTADTTVHAEQNAIFYAAKNGIALDGTTMYVTHNPCKQCAKAIASVGIKRVVYKEFYRDSEGSDFLTKCGVAVEEFIK